VRKGVTPASHVYHHRSAIVVACVIGGFLLEHGNLAVLFSARRTAHHRRCRRGRLHHRSPMKVMKAVFAGILKMLSGKGYTKADYLEVLTMLGEVFYKIRKEGLVSVEGDVDNPKESVIFTKYPAFSRTTTPSISSSTPCVPS